MPAKRVVGEARRFSCTFEREQVVRLRARAVSEGVTVPEIVRRAVAAYLHRPDTPRRADRMEKVDLAEVVSQTFDIPRALARNYIAVGKVLVNGSPEYSYTITKPVGRVLRLEIKKAPPPA